MGITNARRAVLVAYKTADETVNNSDVLQDDDALVLALSPGVWRLSSFLKFDSHANADLKTRHVFSQAVTARGFLGHPTATITSCAIDDGLTYDQGSIAGGGVGFVRSTVAEWIVIVSTACTVKIQWAQSVADLSDTKVHAGSALIAERLY